MAEETRTKQETSSEKPQAQRGAAKTGAPKKSFGRGGRRPRRQRPVSEFAQKIIGIRRVTRVVAGGRRFSFSVAMVMGDKKGSVGVGTGKAGDTALAIQKAINQAKRNMVTLDLNEDNSIPHEVSAKFNSAQVMMMPNYGRGVVAGSAVRSVLELAGVKDVTGKINVRTKNQINIAKATLKALDSFSRPYKKKTVKKEEGEKKTEETNKKEESK
jgi:small subunit ribosomal protein S5